MNNTDIARILAEDIHPVGYADSEPDSDFNAPSLPINAILQGTSPSEVTTNPKIMIVDDEPTNVKVVRKCLESRGYRNFVTNTDPKQAVAMVQVEHPDVLLLDIMMPEVSGLDILTQVRADEQLIDLPVIILTASCDQATKLEALRLGATDFLGKPVDHAELISRTRNTLAAKAHRDRLKHYAWELKIDTMTDRVGTTTTQMELIQGWATTAELRTHGPRNHSMRVGRYSGIIAREMGLDEEVVALIEHATPLHDIGKAAIPYYILLRPSELEATEFAFLRAHLGVEDNKLKRMPDQHLQIYRSHTETGAKVLSNGTSSLLRAASRIALTHHEKWDGSGYPLGLAGTDIPIEGRIAAVANMFDIVNSRHKQRFSLSDDDFFSLMEAGRGEYFEPAVLDAFLSSKYDIVNAAKELSASNDNLTTGTHV